MNRAMILPACIAAGLHVALLGFRSATPSPDVPAAESEAETQRLPLPQFFQEPPEPEENRIEEFKKEESPPPQPLVPQQAEIPTFNPESELVIHRLPAPEVNVPGATLIDSDWHRQRPGPSTGLPALTVFDLQNSPQALVRPAPARPPGTGDSHETVTVEFVVGKDGRVSHASVVASTLSLLEEPCLKAVKRWRFEAGLRKNVPVAFRMQQTFVFTTHD